VVFYEDIPGNIGNPDTIPDNINFTIFSEENNYNSDIQEIFKDYNYNNQNDLNNNINNNLNNSNNNNLLNKNNSNINLNK